MPEPGLAVAMFYHHDLRGDQLPPKTLCLTFDDGPADVVGDGPGPHTTALGRYLYENGIGATYFVVGQYARRQPVTLRQLERWGHLIGNHSFSHPGLAELAAAGGDVVAEVARADEVIRAAVHDPVVFLRPPYGNWRAKDGHAIAGQPQSIVADRLNESGRFPGYVGPIHWDISFGEWDWWRDERPVEDCAAGFLRKIEERQKGIVLLHDSSEEEYVRVRNQTYPLVKLLVPALLERGYRFVRLDEIPQIRAALEGARIDRTRPADVGRLV